MMSTLILKNTELILIKIEQEIIVIKFNFYATKSMEFQEKANFSIIESQSLKNSHQKHFTLDMKIDTTLLKWKQIFSSSVDEIIIKGMEIRTLVILIKMLATTRHKS